MNDIITSRVESLRHWMRKNGLAAYIFPSTDPHSGEYVPDHWKAREWISGFNGSAGIAAVTLTRAALWTDSRYWLAAEEQTAGTPFKVIRCSRNTATPEELLAWIDEPGVVGLDAWTNTLQRVEAFQQVAASKGITIRTDIEPTAELWDERPPLPESPIEIQPLEYAGETAASKIERILEAVNEQGADAAIITQLDDIAWTLNLRGTDVHCTPVFVAYLIIQPTAATLYVNPAKLTTEVQQYLSECHVQTAPYQAITHDLHENGHLRYLIDPETTNFAIINAIAETSTIIEAECPVAQMKTMKNAAEIAGLRHAMLKDGVAMVKFLRWLEEEIRDERLEMRDEASLTEISIDRKLTSLRAEQPGFRDISFDTIAGYGPHAAIVHYEATPETDVPLEPHGLLLLDSGAQYTDGTTDITRTIALGPLTDDERCDYTLVLKGHIRLAMAVFPDGSSGTQLDVLARYAMWQEHKNYGHGTGHGVGSYLSVHEGPHQFRMNWMPAPLRAGMTITIEPGIYIAGNHGCRTENTMLIVEDAPHWLRLEPLTLCPIDTTPIIREMMAADELDYINKYHARVREALLPLLDDEADRAWLVAHTAAL